MQFTMLHDVIMYLMIASVLFATFIIIERSIFFSTILREGKKLDAYLHSHLSDKELHRELKETFSTWKSPQARALCEVVETGGISEIGQEYYVQAVYVDKQGELNKRLWILDTIVTLSPLMGLLGTIFGIIDAFHSLSSGSNSDPAAVSRGIGTALFATGFGIFIALYSMMFFNYFNSKVEHINNQIKLMSLTVLAHR